MFKPSNILFKVFPFAVLNSHFVDFNIYFSIIHGKFGTKTLFVTCFSGRTRGFPRFDDSICFPWCHIFTQNFLLLNNFQTDNASRQFNPFFWRNDLESIRFFPTSLLISLNLASNLNPFFGGCLRCSKLRMIRVFHWTSFVEPHLTSSMALYEWSWRSARAVSSAESKGSDLT